MDARFLLRPIFNCIIVYCLSQGVAYVALYDYDAQDDDEVSFLENDRIINSEKIDEGWIIGTVQRTSQRGMIPANYIEKV